MTRNTFIFFMQYTCDLHNTKVIIRVYRDNHEKHCSQISVSTDIKKQIQ